MIKATIYTLHNKHNRLHLSSASATSFREAMEYFKQTFKGSYLIISQATGEETQERL